LSWQSSWQWCGGTIILPTRANTLIGIAHSFASGVGW